MESRWSEQEAQAQPELEGLLYASRLSGADTDLVLWGGGNTSAKVTETDFRGREVRVLRVKGSGSDLKTIQLKDFPGVRLDDVLPLQDRSEMSDEDMVAYLANTLMEPASPRPSIETLLHAFIPAPFVIHTHADAILALTNTPSGRTWVKEALGNDAGTAGQGHAGTAGQGHAGTAGRGQPIWIDYRRPGFALSKHIADAVKAQPDAGCVVMEKHGLITWGDTAREAYENTIKVVTQAERFVAQRRRARPEAEPALDAAGRRRVYLAVAPLIRGLAGRTTSSGDLLPAGDPRGLTPTSRVILRFDDSPDVLAFASDPTAARLSQIGPATPDHLVNTKRTPLYVPLEAHPHPPIPSPKEGEGEQGRGEGTVLQRGTGGLPSPVSGRGDGGEGAEATITAIRDALEPAWREYAKSYLRYVQEGARKEGRDVSQADLRPRVVLLPGVGMVTLGKDVRAARISADIYHHAVATIRNAETLESYASLDAQDCYDVEYWPLELYKLTLAPPEKQLARRVALVTGGASGIGKAVAQRLASEGAHVVVLDLNGEGAEAAAQEIARANGDGRAVAVKTDVSSEADVCRAYEETVLAYGGVDVVVNNAGLSRSHPVEDTPLEEWELLMGVLGRGYFLVAREAFRTMKAQGIGGSLVFVASKNAMVGGKDNVPYSAAKAAELHMARCLAEEGGASGIRVNTVCPDAVLQGSSIWNSGWRNERARTYGIQPDELEEFYRKRTTLKVNILPEDIAEAALFFASDRAAKTTGGVLTVDGGVAAAYVR